MCCLPSRPGKASTFWLCPASVPPGGGQFGRLRCSQASCGPSSQRRPCLGLLMSAWAHEVADGPGRVELLCPLRIPVSFLAGQRKGMWHLESSASTAERPEPVCRFKVRRGKAESNWRAQLQGQTLRVPSVEEALVVGEDRPGAASVWPTCRVDPWRRCGPLRYSTVRNAPEEKEGAECKVFSFPPACSVCTCRPLVCRSRVGWAGVRGGGLEDAGCCPALFHSSFVACPSPPLVVLAI